ncbi:hypothetical protein MMC10_009705 [Thelotrema lepadinum]|nr:hypothetical protein [Thelotrema lepadinum]
MGSLAALLDKWRFQLTFGVEIEFLMIADKPASYHSIFQSLISQVGASRDEAVELCDNEVKKHTREEVATAFRGAGLLTYVDNENHLASSKFKWMIKGEPELVSSQHKDQKLSIYPIPETKGPSAKWSKFVLVDFEVNTPALDFEDPASFQKLDKGLEIIRSFPTTYASDDCSVHIHFSGRLPEGGLDLKTLKNFLYLIALCERPLAGFHPEERLCNWAAKPTSLLFSKGDRNPETMARIISEFQSVPELVRWASTKSCSRDQPREKQILDRSFAFNFTNLLEGRPKQTLEARVHMGSLNSEVISRWVKTLGALIDICHHKPDTLFLDLGRQVSRNPQYGALQMLLDLGLCDLERQWRGHTYSWTANDLKYFASMLDPEEDHDLDEGVNQQQVHEEHTETERLWIGSGLTSSPVPLSPLPYSEGASNDRSNTT